MDAVNFDRATGVAWMGNFRGTEAIGGRNTNTEVTESGTDAGNDEEGAPTAAIADAPDTGPDDFGLRINVTYLFPR